MCIYRYMTCLVWWKLVFWKHSDFVMSRIKERVRCIYESANRFPFNSISFYFLEFTFPFYWLYPSYILRNRMAMEIFFFLNCLWGEWFFNIQYNYFREGQKCWIVFLLYWNDLHVLLNVIIEKYSHTIYVLLDCSKLCNFNCTTTRKCWFSWLRMLMFISVFDDIINWINFREFRLWKTVWSRWMETIN